MYSINQIRSMNVSNRRKFSELAFSMQRMHLDYRTPYFEEMVEMYDNEYDAKEKESMARTLIQMTKIME